MSPRVTAFSAPVEDYDHRSLSFSRPDPDRQNFTNSSEEKGTASESGRERRKNDRNVKSQAPSISLPKGGGALKSIDEKFSINPNNGTSELSFTLPFSQSRGTGPTLALKYNSGSGNSPFGLGWSISLPSIQRSTTKELPRYRDAEESDVFSLSGAEDLVPAYYQDNVGVWTRDVINDGDVTAARYRPRVEGPDVAAAGLVCACAAKVIADSMAAAKNRMAAAYGRRELYMGALYHVRGAKKKEARNGKCSCVLTSKFG
jgi:hypothetical protein